MESRIPVSEQDGEVLYNLTKYRYDKAGNHIQERRFCEYQTKDSEGGIVHTIDYTYDADNRLTKVSDCTGAVLEYRYDNNNRRIFEKRRINDTAERVFRYIYEQLTKVISPNEYQRAGDNGKGLQYTYDAQGNILTVSYQTRWHHTGKQYL